MMLNSNKKVKVHSSDRDTDFFDIVAGVLQRGSSMSVHNLPRLRTSNIDRSNKRKWLYTKKRQTTEDTPQKLLRVLIMQMT